MRKWRIGKILNSGEVFIADEKFWTRRGAQKAADGVNGFMTSMPLFQQIVARMVHPLFVPMHVDRIPEKIDS
jgi:hypothetical protein